MKTEATIIPVAAGKGGVGKTFLTANLAMALADSLAQQGPPQGQGGEREPRGPRGGAGASHRFVAHRPQAG